MVGIDAAHICVHQTTHYKSVLGHDGRSLDAFMLIIIEHRNQVQTHETISIRKTSVRTKKKRTLTGRGYMHMRD